MTDPIMNVHENIFHMAVSTIIDTIPTMHNPIPIKRNRAFFNDLNNFSNLSFIFEAFTSIMKTRVLESSRVHPSAEP